MKRLLGKLATLPAILALFIVVLTGAAFAFWVGSISSAPSQGTATAEAAKQIQLGSATGSAGKLYPGRSGDVTVQITNPYTSAPDSISVTQLNGTVTTDDPNNCPGSNFTLSQPAGLPFSISPDATVTTTLSNVIQMNANAASTCQGRTVTVTYTVSGKLG